MTKDNLKFVQGQELSISELRVTQNNGSIEIEMNVECAQKLFAMKFYNAANIRIQAMSNPLVIEGFELVDNKSRQWDRTSRYTVSDFETDSIEFVCEDFDIAEVIIG